MPWVLSLVINKVRFLKHSKKHTFHINKDWNLNYHKNWCNLSFTFSFFHGCLHYYYVYYCHNYFESCTLDIVVLNSNLASIKFYKLVSHNILCKQSKVQYLPMKVMLNQNWKFGNYIKLQLKGLCSKTFLFWLHFQLTEQSFDVYSFSKLQRSNFS